MNTSHHLSIWLALLAVALIGGAHSIHAQTANTIVASTHLWSSIERVRSATERDDPVLARRAVVALEQLNAAVFVYRSCGDFESDGRLARVSLETFIGKVNEVTAEVESILPQLSDTKLRSQLSNSLYSYRDGAFWWSRLDSPAKVVTIANLRLGFTTTAPAERFFTSTVPYTIVIHWRQAGKYLRRAQRLMAEASAARYTVASASQD